MNIFELLPVYGSSYKVKEERGLNEVELLKIETIEVIMGEYRLQCKILYTNGTYSFMNLDRESELKEGNTLDPKKATIRTLVKEDEEGCIYTIL